MTAPDIRNICKTNSDTQFVSLLKQIFNRTKFRSVATDWCFEHGQVAKCQYTNLMKNTSNFLVFDEVFFE